MVSSGLLLLQNKSILWLLLHSRENSPVFPRWVPLKNTPGVKQNLHVNTSFTDWTWSFQFPSKAKSEQSFSSEPRSSSCSTSAEFQQDLSSQNLIPKVLLKHTSKIISCPKFQNQKRYLNNPRSLLVFGMNNILVFILKEPPIFHDDDDDDDKESQISLVT